MITNREIDECLVMAEITADDLVTGAIKEFYRPDVEMEAIKLWSGLEEPLKALVRMRAPEAVKRIEELMKER